MKIYKLITVALAAVFFAGNAPAQNKKEEKNRFQLQAENKALRAELDSLKMEIERYKADIAITDSINDEMTAIFEGNAAPVIEEPDRIEYTAEVSDSLLNIWYAHKKTAEADEGSFDMDSVKFESNVPDEVYIQRIKQMNSFITLPYNDIVRQYIILYSEKMPSKMGGMLGLCKYYMPIFEETFNRYDLPEELKAMAIIESALNPLAVSRAGAKGMWQFMYATAKMYGLHIDSFVDERLDPVKSADAAARYLQDAYEIFGDWNLAIASYNCGAGNVNKAIRRSGGSREFWDIWPYLPRETRGYVPAFVGALYAMEYYKEHGIKPSGVEMPAHVDTFKINKMLHLKQVSELTGAPLAELKNLNPQYRHEIIPGNEREFILRMPYQFTNAFIDHEDSVYRHKAEEYFNPTTIKRIKEGGDGERIVHKVRSGEYLGKIASKYRVTVSQIKKWNNLRSNNIRVGQRLVIYRGGRGPVSTSSSSSSSSASSSSASSGSSSQGSTTYHTVRSGDTLGAIAIKYGTSVAKIKELNGLTSNNIKVGQKLKIKGSASGSSSSASKAGTQTTYTVKSGDSLYSIAKNYPGVSADDIMNHNGLNNSSIKPGMKLKIPAAK